MTRDQLLEKLRPLDDAKVEALARSLIANARAAPQAAVQVAQGPDEEAATKAVGLLINLEDLAIAPMVEAGSPPSAKDRVFLLTQAVNAELALRRKVVARLDKLLDDKTPVPLPNVGRAEIKPAPRRVCDEAYLLMRQLVSYGEPMVDRLVQAKLFLGQSDDFKDAQIKKARASDVWNHAITGKDLQ